MVRRARRGPRRARRAGHGRGLRGPPTGPSDHSSGASTDCGSTPVGGPTSLPSVEACADPVVLRARRGGVAPAGHAERRAGRRPRRAASVPRHTRVRGPAARHPPTGSAPGACWPGAGATRLAAGCGSVGTPARTRPPGGRRGRGRRSRSGVAAWWAVRDQAEPVPVAVPRRRAAGSASAPCAAPAATTRGDGATSATRPASSWSTSPARYAAPASPCCPPGSRVVDALEAAGGARRGVDLTSLNLARPRRRRRADPGRRRAGAAAWPARLAAPPGRGGAGQPQHRRPGHARDAARGRSGDGRSRSSRGAPSNGGFTVGRRAAGGRRHRRGDPRGPRPARDDLTPCPTCARSPSASGRGRARCWSWLLPGWLRCGVTCGLVGVVVGRRVPRAGRPPGWDLWPPLVAVAGIAALQQTLVADLAAGRAGRRAARW